MNPAAPDLEVEAGVLMNIFQTVPGDPFSLVYTTVNFDLMEYAGETVRLRAALARNRGYFPFAIDDVTCTAAFSAQVPTLGVGLIAMAAILEIVGFTVMRKRKFSA